MNVTLNGLHLPDDLIWRDEFDWAPVEQVVTPTLSGALLVEETAKPEGRPITLVGHCPPRHRARTQGAGGPGGPADDPDPAGWTAAGGVLAQARHRGHPVDRDGRPRGG